MSKTKDDEIYAEAQRQEELSRKLTGPAKLARVEAPETKPQAMVFIEGLLNSKNPV